VHSPPLPPPNPPTLGQCHEDDELVLEPLIRACPAPKRINELNRGIRAHSLSRHAALAQTCEGHGHTERVPRCVLDEVERGWGGGVGGQRDQWWHQQQQ
jgi:hypothetical protein